MRYSFRNTLCGLAVLAAAGLLADRAYAQGTITLLADDDDEVSLDVNTPDSEDISLNVDVSLPNPGGLISPTPQVAAAENQSDVIPVEVEVEVEKDEANNGDDSSQISVDFDDPIDEADIEISAEPAAPVAAPQSQPVSQAQPLLLGAGASSVQPSMPTLNDNINNELFNRMSDLERQTTLLNLELKKERIANDIAAVKAQREKAQREEQARKEEEERKKIEWQNQQERLMVEEQRKLKETEIALEKLRQEKIIKAYKETMLASTQSWIKRNAETYAELAKKDEQLKNLLNDYKNKMSVLQQKAEETRAKAEIARVNHDKKVANLESQISILKTRLEQEMEKAKQAIAAGGSGSRKNPFASSGTSEAVAPEKVRLSKEYAIMEITGHGDDLAARLINEDGDVFMARVGTTLRNGYTIDEITKTFLSAVKENDKDYLYFSAGGILDREPTKPEVNIKDTSPKEESSYSGSEGRGRDKGRKLNATKGIPSLGRGMIVK